MYENLVDAGAQVVDPSLAALLADPAGKVLAYRRPLPVAMYGHQSPQSPASDHGQWTERARKQYKLLITHRPCTSWNAVKTKL